MRAGRYGFGRWRAKRSALGKRSPSPRQFQAPREIERPRRVGGKPGQILRRIDALQQRQENANRRRQPALCPGHDEGLGQHLGLGRGHLLGTDGMEEKRPAAGARQRIGVGQCGGKITGGEGHGVINLRQALGIEGTGGFGAFGGL